jgi:hypothetical protein
MNWQQASPNKAVLTSSILLVLAAAAFGAAVYYFDGVTLLTDFATTQWARLADGAPAEPPSVPATSTPDAVPSDRLALPAGMPESFALRLWQEQVDSQRMIGYLAKGELSSLTINSVETTGSMSVLKVNAQLQDGTRVPGEITMRRFGDAWFVASATADENRDSGSKPLPAVEDVDLALLNTIIAEQLKSKEITQEYADGRVRGIELGKPEPGANTVRIPVTMDEDHEEGYADLVLLSYNDGDDELWFIARFAKTGSEPLKQ